MKIPTPLSCVHPTPLACLVFAAVLAVAAPGAAAAEAAGESPEVAEAIDRAIEKVYPALVQILVLTLDYSGGRERKFEAAGSGSIISWDGYVITNHHVAGRAAEIRCVLSTRDEIPATLVGTDALSDIAVLKLDLSARKAGSGMLPIAHFGSSSAVQVGDVVLAMGCPLALSQSVTKGIVANTDMMLPRFLGGSFLLDGEDVGSLVKWIGHDATIQPGNSGGPLVNLEGEIIGINEIGLGSMGGAIPSDLARMIAADLIAHGHVIRPWVGAAFQPLLKSATLRDGVLVGGIMPGSPAEKIGFHPGDVVLALNGHPVKVEYREELPAFNDLLLRQPLGQPLVFDVMRGSERLTLAVNAEKRDDALGREAEVETWGITIREISTMEALSMRRTDKRGVLVGSVREGGPVSQSQPPIESGDVIVDIGGKAVEGFDAFLTITKGIVEGKKEPVPTIVTYEREEERFITLVEIGIRKSQPPTPEVRKAWFPAATQVLSRKLAKAMGLEGKKGVRLTRIYPESIAITAGFQVGDIITHIDGVAVEASEPHDVEVFSTMVRAYKVGTEAEFTVIRQGETSKIKLTLGEAPKPERELVPYEDTFLGFKARDIAYADRIRRRWSMTESGALVTQVESGGWAGFGGLGDGDLIQGVDGTAIKTVADLEAALTKVRVAKPRRIPMLIKSGITTSFIELEPRWPEK